MNEFNTFTADSALVSAVIYSQGKMKAAAAVIAPTHPRRPHSLGGGGALTDTVIAVGGQERDSPLDPPRPAERWPTVKTKNKKNRAVPPSRVLSHRSFHRSFNDRIPLPSPITACLKIRTENAAQSGQ